MQPKSIILFFYGYILFFRRQYLVKSISFPKPISLKIFPNKLTKEELSNIKSILQGAIFAHKFAKYPPYEFPNKIVLIPPPSLV